MSPPLRQRNAVNYLRRRTGTYTFRCQRYAAVMQKLREHGLTDDDLIVDLGAGYGDFDYYLRTNGYAGRYLPVDAALDGTDLETYRLPIQPEYVTAIEIVEHLHNWRDFLDDIATNARSSAVITTPNAHTVDVLGIDDTHVMAFTPETLQSLGWTTQVTSFFGQPNDSILAWRA